MPNKRFATWLPIVCVDLYKPDRKIQSRMLNSGVKILNYLASGPQKHGGDFGPLTSYGDFVNVTDQMINKI
jgi:hypothetical protein